MKHFPLFEEFVLEKKKKAEDDDTDEEGDVAETGDDKVPAEETIEAEDEMSEGSSFAKCSYCGKNCGSVGSGSNMGSSSKPMCERCYENGGDDE